ncbi:MAG: hypothetical protein IPH02_00850 [Sphingobacteriales bacterium]|nr:hypothetical protein [Sphingobacteriales bacterium]
MVKIKGEFGETIGRVYFRTGDDGGADSVKISPNLITWSDTLITVNVPSETLNADSIYVLIGSGYISIFDGLNQYAKSPKRLVIPYSLSNTAISGTTKHIHLAGLIDGGYRIVYDTSFYNNSKALTAFRRAVEKWRCATGVKIEECCTPKSLCIKAGKDIEKGVCMCRFPIQFAIN